MTTVSTPTAMTAAQYIATISHPVVRGVVVRTEDGTPIGVTYRDSSSLRWRCISVTSILGIAMWWSPGFATREEAKAFLLAQHKPQVAQEDAEKFANEVIGPPVDSHVRRAYAGAKETTTMPDTITATTPPADKGVAGLRAVCRAIDDMRIAMRTSDPPWTYDVIDDRLRKLGLDVCRVIDLVGGAS